MESAKPERLLSLDALRGFDMFWIIGGDSIIHALKEYTGWSWLISISNELTHVDWNGFQFYDLVFPLFLFLSGVAMPYSITRQLESGVPKKDIYTKVFLRALTLFIMGIVYNGLGDWKFQNIRFASVLGQIGIAYFFAAVIFLNTNWKQQIYWIIGILLGYWGLQAIVPLLYGGGPFTMEGSINAFFDQRFMPGKLYLEIHDPEGWLVKISATATALIGALTGAFIKNGNYSKGKKTSYLFAAGILLLILSFLWNFILPVNKNLWTSSFVIKTAGWSIVLLSAFYFIIDAKGYKKWAFFFVIIGMNPITIYLASNIIDFGYTVNFIFAGLISFFTAGLQPVVFGIILVLLKWVILWFMYKRKIFLKV
ncbi:MAG: DUF5009 domain-containing protein [Melioribacteraceae bacterium]